MSVDVEKIVYDKKIVLYGLGTETERLINQWNGKHEIIGLLDGFRNQGEQFGYPIIDIEQLIGMNNFVIIVVARPGSCKAIVKRIGAMCKEHNIPLFDVRGKDLLEQTKVVYDFSKFDGGSKTELIHKAKSVDVISFDLFDT